MRNKEKSTARLSFEKFATYAAAGAVATVGLSDEASADITYSLVDVLLEDTVAGDSSGQGIRLGLGDASSFNVDFFHSVGAATASTGFALAGGNLFGGTFVGASIAGFGAGAYNYASNLVEGVNLSTLTNWLPNTVATATMAFNAGFTSSQFLAAGEGFIGLRFDNGSGFSFGWARVDMNGAPLNSFTVVDFAYADPGEAILTGQVSAVPEPGSLACLAMGAVGTVAWRNRKKKAA